MIPLKKKTVRLILPQWQGGMNPNYVIGAEILAAIVPQSSTTETLKIPVSQTAETHSKVDGEETLLRQMRTTYETLQTKQADRVITLGGDCSISEAPFDYLHGRYPNHFGMIWLDAHPDISSDQNSHHVHEMVVANLLKKGAPKFSHQVANPLTADQVFFAGLQYRDLRAMDQMVNTLKIPYATPEQTRGDHGAILAWLKQNEIKHLVIHWDLDVLSPDDYRSILPAEPYLKRDQFGAAIGDLKLKEVIQLLLDLGQITDIVGLSIAEHMPWDAINLRSGLAKLPIFE
ncbi:arginase family protein [Pediococcus siamensis]|uniref:arginase family protein n=1 Tax=Pediococcus siamensis TaxID=381829 RepID=UPI00399FE0C3